VLFGIGDRARRIGSVEELLLTSRTLALDSVPELVAAAITPSDDVHASADYRRELAGRLAVEVITDALERAT
jgi:carbon-monoxide dehydrogenase medium subunit